jgi:hypothetical protein
MSTGHVSGNRRRDRMSSLSTGHIHTGTSTNIVYCMSSRLCMSTHTQNGNHRSQYHIVNNSKYQTKPKIFFKCILSIRPSPNVSAEPVACSVGYYQDEPHQTICQPCPVHHVQSSPGQSSCNQCPAGYACPASTPNQMTACAPGSCSGAGWAVCMLVTEGSYAPMSGADCGSPTQTIPCVGGNFCKGAGGRNFVRCPSGQAIFCGSEPGCQPCSGNQVQVCDLTYGCNCANPPPSPCASQWDSCYRNLLMNAIEDDFVALICILQPELCALAESVRFACDVSGLCDVSGDTDITQNIQSSVRCNVQTPSGGCQLCPDCPGNEQGIRVDGDCPGCVQAANTVGSMFACYQDMYEWTQKNNPISDGQTNVRSPHILKLVL